MNYFLIINLYGGLFIMKNSTKTCLVIAIILIVAGLSGCRNQTSEPYEPTDYFQNETFDTEVATPETEYSAPPPSDDLYQEIYYDVPETNEAADWIMLFGDETITENELTFIASIMGIDPAISQEVALNQLIEFLAIISRANRHGLGVTPEEREEILPVAQMTVEMMGLGGMVSDERLVDFFEAGNLLTRLLDYYVTDFNLELTGDEPEFLAFADANRNFLANLDVQYIINTDIDTLLEIHENFHSWGIDFGELVAEHSLFYSTDDAVVYSIRVFEQIFIMYDHDRNALFQLQAGELSHVFSIEEFYFLVYVYSRTEATDAEMEAAYMNERFLAHRAESIAGLVETWVSETMYILNHDALDAVR